MAMPTVTTAALLVLNHPLFTLAVGRWFPLGTPVSSTRKLISSSFHRLDMTLAVAEALTPNKPLKNLFTLVYLLALATS